MIETGSDFKGKVQARWTENQKEAVMAEGRPLLVEAGAGTGKTWVLVERFLRLLEAHPDWPLEAVVAITFTEKAAREMRARIRQRLREKAKEEAGSPSGLRFQALSRQIERLRVSTIHSFCTRVLRENALTIGLDPLFVVLDEQDATLLKRASIRRVLQDFVENQSLLPELASSLRLIEIERELIRLMAERGSIQRLWSSFLQGATLPIWRERWQGRIEVMQAVLWRDRVEQEKNLPLLLDFFEQMTEIPPADRLTSGVEAARRGVEAFRQKQGKACLEAWAAIGDLRGGVAKAWGGAETLQRLKEGLKHLREIGLEGLERGLFQTLSEADDKAFWHLRYWGDLWEHLEAVYRAKKEADTALDFDDLESKTEELLGYEPRPPRLTSFLRGIRSLLVDEFQDTNRVQQKIIGLLVGGLRAESPLFLVGDAKQSIYRFRQSQVSVFSRTAEHLRGLTGQEAIRLDQSFRTHRSLVEACNAIFDKLFQPQGLTFEDYEAHPGPLRSERLLPPEHPASQAPLEITLIPSRGAEGYDVSSEEARVLEARYLASRLHDLLESGFPVWDKKSRIYRPIRKGDIAILFRATAGIGIMEEEFKRAGLACISLSGRGFYERPEIRDLLALLDVLQSPQDDFSLAVVLRSPMFGLSDETLFHLRFSPPQKHEGQHEEAEGTAVVKEDAANLGAPPKPKGASSKPKPRSFWEALASPPATDQDEAIRWASAILQGLRQNLGLLSVEALLSEIIEKTGYEALLAKIDQEEGVAGRSVQNVRKLQAFARENTASSLAAFLLRLRDLQAIEVREGEATGDVEQEEAIQMMSIHAAKGLEFPVVAVADLGRRPPQARGSAQILSDPSFGLAAKSRDPQGEWQKPLSFQCAEWMIERMEEAENRRLLYVALTRAADLLLLSGRTGIARSWLSTLLSICAIDEDGAPLEARTEGPIRLLLRRLDPQAFHSDGSGKSKA